MSIKFEKAHFITSTLAEEEFDDIKNSHGIPMPEIAIVGKSNVGKSSLINHLLKKQDLAKVSSKPGKTQTINFFNVDEKLALVDLPGYGFARVPLELKMKWAKSLDGYLRTRKPLKLLIILLDCRHKPSKEDIELILWAKAYNKPFIIILTKYDKLRAKERKSQKEKVISILCEQTHLDSIQPLVYSVKNLQMRQVLINTINQYLFSETSENNETPQ
jgi:GTP-binding protein